MKRISILFLFFLTNCSTTQTNPNPIAEETAFKDIRQVTFDGVNAQAHWSFNDDQIIFQRSDKNRESIFTLNAKNPTKIHQSNWNNYGEALTKEPSYQISPSFIPEGDRVLLSSSNDSSNPSIVQIFLSKKDGSDWLPAEPASPHGYQAELDVCKNWRAVFTSDRDGERTLYLADIDHKFGTFSNVTRIAHISEKNNHAHFSSDCTKLVWNRAVTEGFEIWTSDLDGNHAQKITNLNESTSPVFTPDGNHIIFSKNRNLYQILSNGHELKRITYSDGEEKDPSFSHDGKKIIFSSSRGASNLEMNLFIADWKNLSNEEPIKDSKTENPSQYIQLSEPKTSTIQELVKNSTPAKTSYLGADIDRSNRSSSTSGVKIKAIALNSPALKAGLQKGDRIVGIIGSKAYSILSIENFDEAMNELKPAEKIKIQVRRGPQLKLIELEAKLRQKN